MTVADDLLRPEAYGALHPRVIELVETHVSQVVLLEADVFKRKKPVNLGFLDFTTLERREAACRAEVELNARLAPGIYLGVVAVRADASGRAFVDVDGRGEARGAPILDYVVHMRRLPDERRADVLLARRELSAAHVDALASRLARFHEEAPGGPEALVHGRVEAILRNVEENFAQTRERMAQYLPEDQSREIREWQSRFLEEHAALFQARIDAGRVRDGHGDLRLEHVYFETEGLAPTIIDCIEFSERFRFADVCADVAFLSMDLEAHGRVDLAERFLARYARDSDDYGLYALVDFYEGYRAFVRAKVAMILAADASIEARVREKAAAEARRHLLLALSEGRRSVLPPSVVAVGGIIASGKSTLAQALAAEMGAPAIEADRTRKSMLGVAPEQPVHEAAWSGAYDPAFTEAVYAEVLRRADVVVGSGRPVVIDASFRSPAMREAARRIAIARGVPFFFVECRTDPEVCRARLASRERTGGVSDGRLAIFDAFRARFEAVSELAASEHLVVDTARPLAETLAFLRKRLPTWPAGLST